MTNLNTWFRVMAVAVVTPMVVAGCVQFDEPSPCEEQTLEGTCGMERKLRMFREGENRVLSPLAAGAYIDVSVSRKDETEPLPIAAADVLAGNMSAEPLDATTLRLTVADPDFSTVEIEADGRVDTFEIEARAIDRRALVPIFDELVIGPALIELAEGGQPGTVYLPGASILVKEERYDVAGERLFGKLQPSWASGGGFTISAAADNLNRAEVTFDAGAVAGTYDLLEDPGAGQLEVVERSQLDVLQVWTGSLGEPFEADLSGGGPSEIAIELSLGVDPELVLVTARDARGFVAVPPKDEALDLRLDGGDLDLVRIDPFETVDALKIEVSGTGVVTGTLAYGGFEVPVTIQISA